MPGRHCYRSIVCTRTTSFTISCIVRLRPRCYKPRVAKARAKPKKKAAAPAKRAREGERETHYTDLRKVTLANALKRLR